MKRGLSHTIFMQRIVVRDRGLVAALFHPKSPGPFPLIVTLNGFRGGVQEERAQWLASHGFASLALAYFGCVGLPSSLQEIPLEYCERAIDWVKSCPAVDPDRIALWGVSRGAELSLLLGSIFPRKIQAIAASLPASAVYGSIQTDAPAWTYRGQPLCPNAPLPVLRFDPQQGKGPENALALTPFFLEGMKAEAAFAASQIPVENIQCPLLLISASDDQMWPSTLFAEQIVERLKRRGSPISCTHLAYPGAGHAISSSDHISELHPVANLWFAFGGNPRDNAYAKADSWNKTLHFFAKTLKLD